MSATIQFVPAVELLLFGEIASAPLYGGGRVFQRQPGEFCFETRHNIYFLICSSDNRITGATSRGKVCSQFFDVIDALKIEVIVQEEPVDEEFEERVDSDVDALPEYEELDVAESLAESNDSFPRLTPLEDEVFQAILVLVHDSDDWLDVGLFEHAFGGGLRAALFGLAVKGAIRWLPLEGKVRLP